MSCHLSADRQTLRTRGQHGTDYREPAPDGLTDALDTCGSAAYIYCRHIMRLVIIAALHVNLATSSATRTPVHPGIYLFIIKIVQ